jgi:hypothetical protein
MVARRESVLFTTLVILLAGCGSSSSGGGGGSGGTSDAGHDVALGGSGGGADAAIGGSSGSAGSSGASAGSGGVAGSGGSLACAPNGGVSQADCQGLCDKVATAGCANDPDVATCTSDCKSAADNYANECEPKSVALVDCEKNATLTCSSSGEYEATGCDPALQEYLGCTACIPTPGDACSCCLTQYCCTERKALFGDPDFFAFLDCRDTCGFDPGCWETMCDAQYPTTSTKYYDFNFCVDGLCHDECF